LSTYLSLHSLNSRRIRWAVHVVCIKVKNKHRKFVGKLEEKRPHGRPRHRWKGNIKMDLRETGQGGVD